MIVPKADENANKYFDFRIVTKAQNECLRIRQVIRDEMPLVSSIQIDLAMLETFKQHVLETIEDSRRV